jgi:hypothetical protein
VKKLRGCVYVLRSGERCARSDATVERFWTEEQGMRQEHQALFCNDHAEAAINGLLSVVPGLHHRPRWMDIFEQTNEES